ncbi:hypothetical protein LMH87_003617 [Akanthomyces muscarius]|uniref:Uncharacterized protein n=1 Tax=Akanthomyces muscarius TaxID=2231603 RepID=A0A9W8Q3N0_AKAMU|nr:hypothetical protein LMH87_003617 [Akanthomyces muscarius]KAJ4144746.1 hypothetical protein LMH87_003617 [Akanthomyces muscarius]
MTTCPRADSFYLPCQFPSAPAGSVSSIPYIVALESLLLFCFLGSLSSVSFGHVILHLFATVEAVHRSVDEHSTCPRSSTTHWNATT